ncbi:MAG: F0F1 ATP synthase subunit delta, partial [Jiangellaceae bacterium]|nr:F0F1 ATP synthase subunit delta [Jiangellaceae bacterium]
MQGPSRQAYAAFDDRLDAALAAGAGQAAEPAAATGVVAGDSVATIGESLFAFAGLLRDQPLVRRALTDPGRSPDEREALVRRLVGD